MLEEIEKQINCEYDRFNKIKGIQEEINRLNKNLNDCIEIVSNSIGNDKTQDKIKRLREENDISYSRISNDINQTLEKTKNTITNLKLEQKTLEEEKKEEEENKSKND